MVALLEQLIRFFFSLHVWHFTRAPAGALGQLWQRCVRHKHALPKLACKILLCFVFFSSGWHTLQYTQHLCVWCVYSARMLLDRPDFILKPPLKRVGGTFLPPDGVGRFPQKS